MLVLTRYVGEGFIISGNGLKQDIHIKLTNIRKKDQARIGIACADEILVMRDELSPEERNRLREMHMEKLKGKFDVT